MNVSICDFCGKMINYLSDDTELTCLTIKVTQYKRNMTTKSLIKSTYEDREYDLCEDCYAEFENVFKKLKK